MYRPQKIITKRSSFLEEDLQQNYLKSLFKIHMLVTHPGSAESKPSWKEPGMYWKVPLSGSDSYLWLKTIGVEIFLDNRQKKVAS